MGAARRRQRREAREAAKQILRAGISPQHVGRLAQGEQLKTFMLKVVRAAEQRIDTGEGLVSVREGIAAAKAYAEIDLRQREVIDSDPTDAELAAAADANAAAEAVHEADVDSQSGTGILPVTPGAQSAPNMGQRPMPLTQSPPLRAAG